MTIISRITITTATMTLRNAGFGVSMAHLDDDTRVLMNTDTGKPICEIDDSHYCDATDVAYELLACDGHVYGVINGDLDSFDDKARDVYNAWLDIACKINGLVIVRDENCKTREVNYYLCKRRGLSSVDLPRDGNCHNYTEVAHLAI